MKKKSYNFFKNNKNQANINPLICNKFKRTCKIKLCKKMKLQKIYEKNLINKI